jgi:hypothetical protein
MRPRSHASGDRHRRDVLMCRPPRGNHSPFAGEADASATARRQPPRGTPSSSATGCRFAAISRAISFPRAKAASSRKFARSAAWRLSRQSVVPSGACRWLLASRSMKDRGLTRRAADLTSDSGRLAVNVHLGSRGPKEETRGLVRCSSDRAVATSLPPRVDKSQGKTAVLRTICADAQKARIQEETPKCHLHLPLLRTFVIVEL